MRRRRLTLVRAAMPLFGVVLLVGCRSTDTQPGTAAQGSVAVVGSVPPATTTAIDAAAPAATHPPGATHLVGDVLRWDMDRPRAAAALRQAGYSVTEHGPTKTPAARVSAELGGDRVTAYFDAHGVLNQISIEASPSISEAGTKASRARLESRFGAPSTDQLTIEHRWTLAGDAHISMRAFQNAGGWSVHEEHGRGSATGPVGWMNLMWGAPLAQTEAKLKAAGFVTRVRSIGVDPCSLPNSRGDNCGPVDASSLELSKQDVSGDISIPKARGVVQLSVTRTGIAQESAALADLEAIAKANGKPSFVERTQRTTWPERADGGKPTLQVQQRPSEGKWSLSETYVPPSRRD